MKIGLIDIDSHHYPNLALMKLSAYHKAQGDEVEWYTPFEHYNLVYKSKVFTDSPDYNEYINADKVVQGGTGYVRVTASYWISAAKRTATAAI